MGEEQILIKVSTDYPEIFGTIKKYIDLFNHQMSAQTNGGFYVESVANGLIYIYSDFAAFKKINQQFSPQQITNFLATHEPILPPEILLSGIFTSDNFPKSGITVKYIAQTEPKDKYLFIKEAHFRSYLTEDVSINTKSSDDLIITFHTYDSILFYGKFLVAFMGGLSQSSFSPLGSKDQILEL